MAVLVLVAAAGSLGAIPPRAVQASGPQTEGDAEQPNQPAVGRPNINGHAIGVGETLRADVFGISDADGLNHAVFRFQWVRVDSRGMFSEIEGATGSTYKLVLADLGQTISVRVTFADDTRPRRNSDEPEHRQGSGPLFGRRVSPGAGGGSGRIGSDRGRVHERAILCALRAA